MRFAMSIVGAAIGIYSALIFVRILLSWFSTTRSGRAYTMLARVTDPYLNFFRRFKFLQAGRFDFSPVAAIVALSLIGNICAALGRNGTVHILFIVDLLLVALWSIISFALGFFALVIAIRLFGYIIKANTYTVFWRVIDNICQPVLFRVTQIFFKNRLVRYVASLCFALGVFVVAWLVFYSLFQAASFFLRQAYR
jgi:YggT family protein